MISVLSIALLTQALLVMSGLALLQLCNVRQRIQILPLLAYAWGAGVVLLYLAGRIFVKSEWFLHDWHQLVAGGMLVLIAAGSFAYLRRSANQSMRAPLALASMRWYDVLLIALIVIKVSLVIYICMVNSVMDSDATDMRRYAALAKKIGEGIRFSEVMERGTGHLDPIATSLLPAWIRLFLDRWHDSVASLPWLFAWLGSGWIAFVTSYKLKSHLTISLVCAFLLLSLPLAAIHVFRSGFADLVLMYFMVIGFSMTSFIFLSKQKMKPEWLVLTAVAVLGAALCKSEGKVWALFLLVMWSSYYLHHYKDVPWIKIILTQGGVAVGLFLIYYFVLGEAFFKDLSDERLRLMAPAQFNKQAFDMTLETFFHLGSFGIWWWAVALGAAYLMLAKKVKASIRGMALFLTAMLVSVVYFSNFTANIQFTLNGTNLTRFLLQLSGMMIPIYCAVILNWFPQASPPTPTEKRHT